MFMMLGSDVFVPPTCPVEQNGILPDLRAAPFNFRTHDCTGDENHQPTETETFVSFGEPDERGEYPNLVATDSLLIPIDSPLAVKIRRLAGAERSDIGGAVRDPDYSPQIAKIGETLCDRVAQCHGVINGKCWALGAAGLKKVIEEI
jgi:hypothetical protein